MDICLGEFKPLMMLFRFVGVLNIMKNMISYPRGRAEEAGPEGASSGGAENGGVGDAFPCRALIADWLVRGDHGASQLKAAVVAVVLHQGQRVFVL